jgi:hypothetical protein
MIFLTLLMLLAPTPTLPEPPTLPKPPAAEKPADPKYIVTEATEVFLDGVVCLLADIPPEAKIVALDLATDKKTILKIQFARPK